jgi:hypothetical protein
MGRGERGTAPKQEQLPMGPSERGTAPNKEQLPMGRGKRGCAEARAAADGVERDGLHRIKSCRRWGGARGAQRRSKSKKARSCGCRRPAAESFPCRVRSIKLFFLQNGT